MAKTFDTAKVSGVGFIILALFALFIVVGNIGKPQTYNSRAASSYSITVNQPSPHFNDTINFTAVYPKEGDKKIGRQQMFQPQIQVLCSQNNQRVYAAITTTVSKKQNTDGSITGLSGNVKLGGLTSVSGNQYNWSGGPADCNVNILYYTTKDLIPNFVASSQFSVAE